MTISLKHLFQSAKADGPDNTLVQPSDWNDEHTITMATAKLLGRTTAGTGAVEEITAGSGLTLSAGTLTVSGVPAASLSSDYTGVGSLQLADGKSVLVGHTTSYTIGGIVPTPHAAVTVIGTGATDSAIAAERFSANGSGPGLYFGKSRGATIGDFAAVLDDDILGQVVAHGSVGSGVTMFTNDGGTMRFRADEDWTAVAQGTRIEWLVNANGSSSATVAMTLGSDSSLTVAGDITADNGFFSLPVFIGANEVIGAPPSGSPRLQITGTTSGTGIEIIQFSNDTEYPYVSLHKSRSTTATSTSDNPVSNNDPLGSINFGGSDGTSFGTSSAYVRAYAAEAFNPGEHGTELRFGVTPINSDTTRLAFTIDNSGYTLFDYDVRVNGANAAYLRAGATFSNTLATGSSGSGFMVTPGGQTVMAFDGTSTPALIINKTNTAADNNRMLDLSVNGTVVGRVFSDSSGAVTYQAFVGAHPAPFDGEIIPIFRGTIVSSSGVYADTPSDDVSKRLVKFHVSDTPGDRTIYGVFAGYDDAHEANIHAVGLSHIRFKKDTVVSNGDLIESAGDGTGRVQNDDVIRSSTVGKIVGTGPAFTHPDGSFCVAAVLYCG